MSWEGWVIFALFWVVFVTTPGPNAVNCIQNGMTLGFRKALWGVLAILTQATLFMLLSAAGVTAMLASVPEAFFYGKLIGAAVLIWLGMRGWLNAARPIKADDRPGGVYLKAFLIATINVKSVAGYFAAFTQFIQPDIPVWGQMWVIMPTALTITAASYLIYTAIGAGLGRAAIGAVLNVWVRRIMAACFVIYGVLLGSASAPGRPA
ncbi:threonine/homoserine/homoserine lactone efflux protein [Litoreibacter ponti]|uniref:Threonine/homoserine/homoserine lactone efflux protein n=1 Tax=Litoreibacter ponti TaxID=1510457 RepID=A0A2T6BNR8_9RHOB|nr:LysE family translocator [Litoreibacter ponti]PTX57684.1 threonine/homoserine/homoserine lactone efflux protein [Litoreibacter ponti]